MRPVPTPHRCREKRHLVAGDEERARLVPQDVLRAVAVMHVEIDHRDAGQAPPFQRMQRADGDVAEEAETHGRVFSAWWPGGRVATKALVARPSSTASTAAIIPPTPFSAASHDARAGVGVGVERDDSRLRHRVADGVDIGLRMGEKEVRLIGQWRLFAEEAGKAGAARAAFTPPAARPVRGGRAA
jgi:hypothetical protein